MRNGKIFRNIINDEKKEIKKNRMINESKERFQKHVLQKVTDTLEKMRQHFRCHKKVKNGTTK